MPERIHDSRELIETFLQWLNSKATGLHKQTPINKNQIQELLLGIGLSLRDLDFANFLDDYDEVLVPPYLISSRLLAEDLQELEKVMNTVQKVVQHHLR